MSGVVPGAVLTGLVLGVLTACVVPADTEHVAHSAVTNECANPISAAIGEYSTDFPSDDAPSSLKRVPPGERVSYASPIYLPVSEKLYLWAVVPDAESIGSPQEVKLPDLEQEMLPSGGIVFHITVSGDMCPS